MAMNVQVLNNPLAQFCHNEHKAIARAKKHTKLEWDRLQVTVQNTFEVPKLTLVKLTSSHIFQLLGMIACGVGSILFNMQAKVECDEDLVVVI